MNAETVQDKSFYSVKNIYRGTANKRKDAEITLPDYKEDAGRIIRVEAKPVITNKNTYFQGQNVFADIEGTVYFDVIYITDRKNEKGVISAYKYEAPFDFSVKSPAANLEESKLDMLYTVCEVKCENTAWKLMGPRKLSVKCEILLDISVKTNVLIEKFDAESADEEIKERKIETAIIVQNAEKDYELNEKIVLPDEYLAIGEILSSHTDIYVKNCENKNGITSFEAEVSFYCDYASKDGDETVNFYQPIEIRKEIETESFKADSFTAVRLFAGVAEVKKDADDENERTLFVTVPYSANVSVYKNEEAYICEDVYSTKDILDITKKEIETASVAEHIYSEADIEGNFDLNKEDISGIDKTASFIEVKNTYFENGKLAVEGKIGVHYIAQSQSGVFTGGEEYTDFKTFVNLDYDASKGESIPETEIFPSLDFCEIGLYQNKVLIKAKAVFDILVISKEKILAVTVAVPTEKRHIKAGEVFLYYPDKDEKLWDICKKYGRKKEDVILENGIKNEDEMPDMLIIE